MPYLQAKQAIFSSTQKLLLTYSPIPFTVNVRTMSIHLKKATIRQWSPFIIIVLLVGISIPLTLFSTQQPHPARQYAESKTYQTPATVCGKVTVTLNDNNACPRLSSTTTCTAMHPGTTNNVSTYTLHVTLSSADTKQHVVHFFYLASVCQQGFGNGGNGVVCNCYVNSPNTANDVSVTVPAGGQQTFDISRSAGQNACGTYQYDTYIKDIDGDKTCTWGISNSAGGKAGGYGYCETGTNCANPIAPPKPPTGQGVVNVSIQKTAFSPQTQYVQPGGTVVWTNTDTGTHQTVSDSQTASEIWTSQNIPAGQFFAHTFSIQGTYPYHDTWNSTAKGVIIVSNNPPPPNATATPTPTVPLFCAGSQNSVCATGTPSPTIFNPNPSGSISTMPSASPAISSGAQPSISAAAPSGSPAPQPQPQPGPKHQKHNGQLSKLIRELLNLILEILKLLQKILHRR